MPDKKYLIEIPDMPDSSGVWDADKWERNKDKFMQKYPTANVFELGAYDPNDMDENDQFMLTFDNDEESSGVWDAAKWERNKDKFLAKYPDAHVNRVRYMDYWGDKAKSDQARIAELQQPDEERNARLAEIGYYDDSTGMQVDYANSLGLSPLSSAIEQNSVSGEVTYLDPRVEEFFANDTEYTDKQMELNRLRDEYEANPRVIEQREYEAQMARYAEELEKQIKADMEADVDAYHAGKGADAKHIQDASGANQTIQAIRMLKGEDVGKDVIENEKQERYASALKLLQQAKDARNVAGKGMAGGVADTAKDWARNLGTQSDIEMYNEVGNILTALEQKVGNLNEVSDEVIEENLTNDEKALIRAFFEYNAAMADAGEDMSIWYKGGKIFAESIPFMMEFLVTGGLANSAGRAATSWMGKGFGKWIAKSAKGTAARAAKKAVAKTVSGVAKTVVAAGARTLAAPTTYKNIAEQSVQYGADGHLDREGNMVKAAVDSYIEQLSEMSGAAFGKVLGGVGRLALGKTAFEKVGAWFGNNAVMQNLSKLGFHGLPEEVGEEIFGNALRTITGVDEEALSRMFEKDEFASMIIGFAPMTLFGAGMSVAKMGAVSIGAANAGRRMRQDLSRSYTEEQIDQVEMALDEAKDANEIANAIRPIIMGMQAAGAPLHEVQSVWDYAIAVAKKKAMISAQSAQEMQLAQAKIGEAQERMGGRFWIEDKDGVKSVKQVVLNNGNTAYVVSEPDQDGRVAIINATTGQKGTALPEDIKEESWNGTLNAFGTGLVMADRTQREQQRMQEDRAAQINEVRNRLSADPRINVGTEGSPIYLVVQSFNDAGVRYVAQDGSTGNISWEQAADSIGMPIVVKTDAQIAQEEAETLVAAAAERRAKRAKKDAVGTNERDNAVVDAENAVAEANEAARHIPMNEDGTVNEAAFWEQSPEEYVKWNDEQNQDGGQDSLEQVAIAKQELMGLLQEANAAQNTSNPTTRKAAKKEVERLADRIARLDAIEQSYMQSLEEEKAVVQQTAATPTSSMSEENLESMDAQYQGILGKTRVQGERVRVMQEYLDKISEESTPAIVLTRENYVKVMEQEGCPEYLIDAVREQVEAGEHVEGFMAAGKVFLMADGLGSIEDSRITYIHERQHTFNRTNPQLVKRVANALESKEKAIAILKSFVGERALKAYKNLPIEGLADEIVAFSMEVVYSNEEFSVDLQSRGIPSEVISIITEIDNEQRQDQRLSHARRRSRRNSHEDALRAGSARQDGGNLEQVSGGVLGEETARPSEAGEGGAQIGEGAEVISETSDDEEPSSPFMAAAQQEGESIRFSITTEESLQDKIRKFAKTKDGKETGWTEDDIESIIAETESLIDAIHKSSTGNEFYDEFAYKEPTIRVDWRDGEAKPIVTWTRANIEYKYDMSADLLCINNEGLEEVLSSDKMVALMEMFIPEKKAKKGEPLIKFTAEDYLELYNTLRDLGFVVPCKGCFDAAGRFKMLPSVAQKFAAEVNAVIDERNKDPKAFDERLKAKAGEETTIEGLPTTASTKSAAIAVGVAGDNLTEHVKWTQLMSADGQTKMLSDWGGIFRAWQRTGAGRPKDKLLPEPYYGDIVSSVSTIIGKYGEKTPSFRDTLVNQGTGLRRNSHSEFRPVLAIDEIQFMRDAFIRNLTVFKYMKELDDVRLFGKMGVKFNMSFFPEYVPGTKVAGLDKDGNYIASEESVGSREFPYQGEDGKRHYDGMKGWAEAQKYINKDVSLSSVIFSIPHLLKALTDVPTPSDMRGIWGSLFPFHSSGATTASLAMQGLGMARANGVGHGFIEAFTDYGKGVTNFEAVQNDRFGEGWYIVSGKKAGTDVEPGHKLEFANGNHYYNRTLGVHLFASGYILDAELPEGVLGDKGELNITDEQKKALMHKFTIDYNDKVRDIKGPYAYKAAADYYIAELPKLGLIPRFDFEVSEDKFLEMCEAANVNPRHPKLGWKGEGNSWSPIDSEAYYSLFCDYGMADPATGEWAPHMPVGYVNKKGEREFRLPENAVEIVKDGLERFSEVRRSENARIDEAIEAFAERSVKKGRINQKDVDKVLGKKSAAKKSAKTNKSGAIDLVEEAKKAQAKHDAKESDVRFRVLDTTNAKLKEKPIKLNGMYRFNLKNAFKGVKDNGGSYPYIKVQLEEVSDDYSGEKIAYNGILEGFAVVRIPKGLITEGEKDNVFFIDPKAIENELWDVLRATENYYEFKHGGAPYQRDWLNADNVRFRVRTEEEREKLFADAKEKYGVTDNFNAAGYMLPDGSLLDFSEANDGGDPNSRSLDHRDIEGVIMDNGVEYDSRWMYIADFMNEGAIRLLPESAGINMIQAPTEEQRKKIFDFIYKYNGEVILEINDERLNSIAYMEYDRRTSPSRIFRDIDGYFKDGIVPQQDIRFRMRGENESAMDFYQSELDAYKAKYNELGTIELYPINQETADKFGYTLKELEETGGVFVEDDDLIAIFVHEDAIDGIVVENNIFHEDVHYVSAFYTHMYQLGEWLWNNVDVDKAFADYRADIEKRYKEEDYHKEMLAYVVADAMSGGKTSKLEVLIPKEYHSVIRKLENEIGYDRRTEESSRESERILQLSDGPASQEAQEDSQNAEESAEEARFRTTEITPEVREEMDAIHASAILMGNFMKAPNGKDTNLTEEQWLMVRTKNFKNWFGDWENDPENASKVVDENGEPKVVYHGSAWRPLLEEKGNAVFKMRGGLMGKGAYFTDNIYTALYFAAEKYEIENNVEVVSEGFLDENGYVTEVFLNIRNEDNIRTVLEDTYYLATSPSQIKSATNNTGEFSEGEGDIRFSIRTKPAPKKAGKGYKVFYLKDGKLYPPMVANLGGVDTPVGVWLDAEEGTRAGVSKTGRPQVKQGGKGTQGGSGILAYRPGWHLGEIPYAIQFNRKDENGNRTLFPADFVWAEVEYANDVDYQEEAMSYGMNANGKFQHSLAGLPKLPTDGSYRYRTNPNPETDPWIITGAMKVNRLLTPSEVDKMVIDAGRKPQERQEGAVTDAQIEALNKELGLVEEEEEVSFRTTGTPTEDVVAEGVSLSPAQLASLAGDIFAALPEDGRKKITDGLNGNILGLQDAILQIPTSLATKEEWNDEDRQMAEVVAEQMTKAVGIEMTRPFSASEALWTLYNAVNKSTDLVSEASRALVRRNLGMGQNQSTLDSVQFRIEDSFENIDEIVNNGKQKVSEENSASAIELMSRLNAINATLTQLRSITAAQRAYDKATVKIVSDLANELLEKGALSDMTRSEIKRLLSAIKDAVGKKDLAVSVERLMDVMIANQLRHGRDRFKDILKIRDKRVDQRGIEVRGRLDVNGQRVMDALREGIGLDLERLEDRINETLNKMFDASDVVKKNSENELAGYELAKLYLQNIKESEQEEKDLRKELKDAKEVYDGGGMGKDAYREFVQSIYAAIRENRMQRVNDYANLFAEVTKMVTESTAKASLLRNAEKARVERIHHYANSDMQGMPSVQQGEVKSSFWNNTILRFLFKPLATFDQMLRSFAPKSRNGEGYLWNHFMGGWLRSSENEFKGIQAAHEQLDAKVRSMFAGVKRWSDLFSIEKKLPTMEVKFWDGEKMADFTLTQGNLLYIYMVNKMSDGEMKLRKMGITEEDVSNIARELDPRFIELADWIQDTFLPGLREKYNTLHEKMFGAPMAAIDNYFPIRVLANARTREVDLAVEESSAKPSTITGSIIKRTKNSLALDILGSDAFDVVLEHIEQMEHWAAFAEFNRDLNTLLSYRKFRNRVQNMRGIYGAGTTVWNNFRSVAEIAAGVYKPAVKGDSLDKLITNIAKGVTGAKISFRVYTALKQFLSAPAFVSDASAAALIKSLANPYKAWTWAMKELPLFEKRWKSRQAGDSRLMETESDWKLWKNKIVELAGRYGMTPNAFVDALTVSIGARAIYETKRKEYVKLGYTQDQAEEKAKRDATVLYNESQQSNESAFLSAAQVDRTVASILITVFRNSSMGYQRMYVDALRNIKHMLKKGYKAESLEYMKKQMMRDGLTEDQAERAANRIYNKSFARSATRLATFGFLVQFAWNLGPYMAYLLMGDDDDEKKDMIKDAAVRGLVGGPVEGLAAGQAISGVLGDFAMSEEISDPMLKLPATSDMESIFRQLEVDPVRAVNDIFNLVIQSGIGVNPQTLTDAVVAIIDGCNGDLETSKEAAFALMRILQTPQSQIEKLYMEEIDFTAEEALDMSVREFAERYAKYKVMRTAPLTKWMYSDEKEKELEDKYIKTFTKKASEMERTHGTEEAQEFFEYYDSEYEETAETLRDLKKQLKEAILDSDTEGEAKANEDIDSFLESEEFKRFEELLPHIKAYEAYRKALKTIDDPKTRSEYAEKMIQERNAAVEKLRGE